MKKFSAVVIIIILPVLLFSDSKKDSAMSFDEAVKNVSKECPAWILNNQSIIDVDYFGFDGKIHSGQLVADTRVAEDLQIVFRKMLEIKFPVKSVIPITKFNWDDFESMRNNNSSAFNFRKIAFSNRLSNHAYGFAIDINPVENPYYTGDKIFPEGASYNPDKPGTFSNSHQIVQLFKSLGWKWGGNWKGKDYQHFEKPLEKLEVVNDKKHYK